ncbi:hypothetical protein EGI31_22435 [Lacihabitans soyangensis]|uniref:Uncharacterized protein n=2 Tax=Lacihabitans soyangensis TaxID=869394 RepID=A0AAE3H6C7_9BACT|nr:hypothetical protein [Lacihabitans soyangensis]
MIIEEFLIFFSNQFCCCEKSKISSKLYLFMKIVRIVGALLLMANFGSFAQSVTINPQSLDLPKVTNLPGCAVADYGKVVFLTSNNKAYVCGGSGWVAVETSTGSSGSLTLPYSGSGAFSAGGLSVLNTAGGLNSAGIQGMTMSAINGANGVLGNAFETAPSGNTAGVAGINNSLNANGYGVYGKHDGGGAAVYGTTNIGKGVYGHTATSGDAVFGLASNINARAGVFENTVAGGIALRTAGTLRFEGQNAAAGRFLRSGDNLGTASWSNITRTEVIKIPAAAFVAHISTNSITHDNQGIVFTGSSGSGSVHAPLTLPNGATVTQILFYYIDGDATLGMISWAIQKFDHTVLPQAYSNIFSGTIPNVNDPFGIRTQGVNTTLVIDNTINFYRLVFAMPFDTDLKFLGAEVRYNYQVNN